MNGVNFANFGNFQTQKITRYTGPFNNLSTTCASQLLLFLTRGVRKGGNSLAPSGNEDVKYFLCLNLQNESKYIYLNYENNTLWSFFIIFALVQRAEAEETGLLIFVNYYTTFS